MGDIEVVQNDLWFSCVSLCFFVLGLGILKEVYPA